KQELLENIIEPSRKIDEKYFTCVVQLRSGKVVSGLLLNRDETVVRLKDAKNEVLELAPKEIESLTMQKKSIMPDQLLRDLTAEQAAHLLAYLESLK
ncbi:MAG TPA: hypothetical protein DCM07_20105, partial [Planctomycetaceae bacterium]|nr:hypothetical protein [Planctomycetaceae bacterium]